MKKYADLTTGRLYVELEEGDVPEEWLTHKLEVGRAVKEARRGRFQICVAPEAVELLGAHGRLLSQSKTAYRLEHPGHDICFNACLFDDKRTEIWFGDINLTLESQKLQLLADQLGTKLYLTPESPYRFQGIRPLTDRRRDQRIRLFRPRSAR